MIQSSPESLEANRLQTLYRYNILDSSPNEEIYDRLTTMVARIFRMPFVLINLVDRERIWIKSGYGMNQYEYKRSGFFCDYTIQLAQPLVVPDATLDPRFVIHPSVIGEPHFRFYAGVPLHSAEGYNLGTLCLFDTKPRTFSAKKQADLQDLASVVVSQMELGLCNQKLTRSKALVSLRDKKLQVAEEHFRIAFNLSAVGMAIHSPNGGYILVNQAFCQMLGYSEEELLQTNFHNLTHPDDLADNLTRLQPLNESQAYPAQFEKRYLHKDGHIIWVLVTVSAAKSQQRQPLYYIIQAQDITERKQAEQLIEGMLSSISAQLVVLDREGIISYVSKSWNDFAEVNGASPEQLGTGVNYLEICRRSAQEEPQALQALEGIKAVITRELLIYSQEYQLVQVSGSPWFVMQVDPMPAEHGGVVITHTNITERKWAEKVLQESEERYRTLAQNFPNGAIILFDRYLRFILVEGSGLSEVGLNNKEYVGKTLWEAFPPDWVEALLPHYQAALAGREYQFELTTSVASKNYNVHVRPIKNEQGEITAGMLVSVDITELYQANRQIQALNLNLEQRVISRTSQLEEANQKLVAEIEERVRLEEELRVALQKEQELSELKDRFVSMTSHEFRTPLSTIRANAELLQRYSQRWTEEKRKELFQRIEDSTMHMTHLLEDILLIGKAEAGKLEVKPGSLNLVNFCQTMVEEIKSGQGVQHEFNFVRNCDSLIALLDEKLMRQIVGNLLSNAVKYSVAGKTVYFELDYQDGEAILTIRDEGIGIPLEDLPHLFEVFHRAKNVGTVQGTGLGLAIVERSVQLHGGTITVESQVGIGTSFTVRLPVRN